MNLPWDRVFLLEACCTKPGFLPVLILRSLYTRTARARKCRGNLHLMSDLAALAPRLTSRDAMVPCLLQNIRQFREALLVCFYVCKDGSDI